MKNWLKPWLCVLLVTALLFTGCGGTAPKPAADVQLQDTSVTQSIQKTYEWLKKDGQVVLSDTLAEGAGDSTGDWIAFDLGRIGLEQEQYEKYLNALEAYVTKAYATEDKLDRMKATEWHRISLVVKALGGDPRAFGTDPSGNPIDLIADGTWDRGKTVDLGMQGNNAYIWALIAMDCGAWEVPENACDTRADIIHKILESQQEDGSFCFMEGSPDLDITCMAVQALAPYIAGGDLEIAQDCRTAIDNALLWIQSQQQEDGTFVSWGAESSESISQLIVALCTLGQNPVEATTFQKGNQNLLDILLSYQSEDGGFCHAKGEESDYLATGQALYALISVYRLENGMNTLYDLTTESTDTNSGSSEGGTCTLMVECGTILSQMENLTKGKEGLIPEDGVIYPLTEVTFEAGESVYDVLLREMQNSKIHMDADYTPVYESAYVKAINNLYEFDCGRWSGWMYCVNGTYPDRGCSKYVLQDGDIVEWHYTCDLGRDLGAEMSEEE